MEKVSFKTCPQPHGNLKTPQKKDLPGQPQSIQLAVFFQRKGHFRHHPKKKQEAAHPFPLVSFQILRGEPT